MEVLIVAKTHMSNAACVVGLLLEYNANIRLLSPGNRNQPEVTEMEIGEIWDCRFIKRDPIEKPHLEDRIILSKKHLRTISNIDKLIRERNLVDWKGSPKKLFNGQIEFDDQGRGYFDEEEEIPDMSVGFWETDTALIKSTDNYGKVRYTYEGNKTYSLPYVGYAKSINRISKGTICRVSLTRIFKGKYWLQLSGWY